MLISSDKELPRNGSTETNVKIITVHFPPCSGIILFSIKLIHFDQYIVSCFSREIMKYWTNGQPRNLVQVIFDILPHILTDIILTVSV